MRKAFIIIIAVILLFGVSGCGNIAAAPEELSLIDVANASNMATGINAFDLGPLPDNTTLEDVKEHPYFYAYLWPDGLSDDEEKAAWKLIVIKDGVASLIPKAQEALQGVARNAYSIQLVINAYNALYPSQHLDYGITLEEAKDAFWSGLWPEGLSDEEERAVWRLIVYDGHEADLTTAAQKALKEGSSDESEEVKKNNAIMIIAAINVYNALNPDYMLPDNVKLAEVKEAIGKDEIWPSFLTDAEAEEAWELIVIEDGLAKVKESD